VNTDRLLAASGHLSGLPALLVVLALLVLGVVTVVKASPDGPAGRTPPAQAPPILPDGGCHAHRAGACGGVGGHDRSKRVKYRV